MDRAVGVITRAVRSNKFFAAVVALFIFQALWIVFSAGYPQPFDENTHLQTIQLYSHHWTPFFNLPPGIHGYGAATHNPYLYHYLLSFPYRLSTHFLHSLQSQIIFLRLFGVAFFATGLVLFRRVLAKTGSPRGLINLTFLFFVLIPVVPLLAGQLNYDNLLMLLVPVSLLAYMRFSKELVAGRFDFIAATGLLSLCAFSSLVKIEFLPIGLALVGLAIYKSFGFIKLSKRQFVFGGKLRAILSGGLLVVASALFIQLYGVNMVRYHTPEPFCDKVLSVKLCQGDGAWLRAHTQATNPTPVSHNPARYTVSWFVRMYLTTFYVRSGGSDPRASYVNVGPYPVIRATAIIVAIGGATLFLLRSRQILLRYPHLAMLIGVALFYYLFLWAHLYEGFLATGQKNGLNGRYLFPMLLPVMLAIGLGVKHAIDKRQNLKIYLAIAALILFLQGGGIITFINASNKFWYWPNDGFSQQINSAAQSVVRPWVIK